MSKIIVTGASGHLGRAVVKELLKKVDAKTVTILSRNLQKVEEFNETGVNIVQADYDDYPSLLAAFKGGDKLYFVSSSELENRFLQHQNVVKAAVEARIKHIFYTSAQRKSEDGSSPIAFAGDAHWQTDNLIKESGLTFTILKHGLYTDILPMFIGDKVMETKTIFLPAGDGKSSYVSRSDLALVGANLLTSDGHDNRIYELGGPRAYSFGEIAEILSELSGLTVQYISPSPDLFSEQLRTYGVPEEMIKGASTFCVAISQGEFDFPSAELAALLGREPQSVKDFLKAAYQL